MKTQTCYCKKVKYVVTLIPYFPHQQLTWKKIIEVTELPSLISKLKLKFTGEKKRRVLFSQNIVNKQKLKWENIN